MLFWGEAEFPDLVRKWVIVARFLHFCYRWRKKRAARGGFARSGALGLPGAVMWCMVVF